MKPKIDPRQAAVMMNFYSQVETARRLGCSARQLRRIAKVQSPACGRSVTVTSPLFAPSADGTNPLLPSAAEELFLMRHYRKLGESYAGIARRFGISKQAVKQRLTQTQNNEVLL